MASFSDLEFGPHPDVEGGVIAKKEFGNGYGVVVERYLVTDERGAILQHTLGADEGYQIGFTKDGEPFFEEPLPSDIIGALSEEAITEIMTKIEGHMSPIIITDDDDEEELITSEGGNVMDFRHEYDFRLGNSIDTIEM